MSAMLKNTHDIQWHSPLKVLYKNFYHQNIITCRQGIAKPGLSETFKSYFNQLILILYLSAGFHSFSHWSKMNPPFKFPSVAQHPYENQPQLDKLIFRNYNATQKWVCKIVIKSELAKSIKKSWLDVHKVSTFIAV